MNITGTFGGYGDRTGFSSLSGAFWDKQHQTRIPSLGDIVSGHSTALEVGFSAENSWYGETSYIGGDTPMSLMNPYHACYIWRRTA